MDAKAAVHSWRSEALAAWRWLTGFCLALALVLVSQPAHAALFVSETVTPTTATIATPTTLTYTLSVTNSSSVTDALSIAQTLPAFTTRILGTTQVRINGTLVSTANPTVAGTPQTCTWANGGGGFNVTTGSTLTVTFQATLNSAVEGTFASSITVTDLNDFDAPATVTPVALVTIGDPPSLSVSKSVAPMTVAAGGLATYTVTINNFGATATDGLTIVDALPPGFTYQAGTATFNAGAIGNPAIAGQQLTWSIPATAGLTEVPANTSRTLAFQVKAPAVNGTFQNTATVSANNALSATTGPTATLQVGTGASISVCKGAGAAGSTPGCGAAVTVAEGATHRYMITITNTGATAVTINSIVDNRPAGTGYFIGSADMSVNGGGFNPLQDPSIVANTMTWSGGPAFPRVLAAGQNLRIRWNHRAVQNESGTFYNQATVNTSNTSQATTGPAAPVTIDGPLVTAAKTVLSPSPATIGAAGGVVQYEITLSNSHPTIDAQMNVTDTLPTGWTYVNNSSQRSVNGAAFAGMPNPGVSGNQLSWTNDGVAPNNNGVVVQNAGTFRIRFQVNVPAGYTPGQYPNNVQAADRIFTNNDLVLTGDTAPVTVVGAPQVSINKSVSASQVLAFQTVQYTVLVRNATTAGANAIVASITDTLPPGFNLQPGTVQISSNGTTFAAFQNPSGTFGTVTWSGGPGFPITLGPGAERYLRFTVQVSGVAGSYDNTANVQGTNFPDVSSGPTANVRIGTPPSVTVCKGAAAANTTSACGATTTVPAGGGTVAYTITIANAGGIDGTGVTVTDTLTAGFSRVAGTSLVSVNGGAFTAILDPTPASGTITWPATFTIPAGGNVRIRFNATTSTLDGSYTNTANAAGTNFTTETSGPTATVTVGTPPAVSIAASPTSLVTPNTESPPYGPVTYTYQINNAVGSQQARGVTMTSILPQYLSIVSGSSQVSVNGGAFVAISDPSGATGTVTWSGLPNITNGQNIRVRFNVAIDVNATNGRYLVESTSQGTNYSQVSIGDPTTANIPALTITGASAVDLTQLMAQARSSGVTLTWNTGAETSNLGYALWRADSADGDRTQVNAGLIGGLGTDAHGGHYTYADASAVAGRSYVYWLEDLEFGGGRTMHGPLAVSVPTDARTDVVRWDPTAGASPTPAPTPTPSSGSSPLAGASPSASPSPGGPGQYLTVLSKTDQSITLLLRTPDLTVTTDGMVKWVSLPGLPLTFEPGLPQVPQAVVPLGAPRDVPYQLDVLDAGDPLVLENLSPPLTPHGEGRGNANANGRQPEPDPTASPEADGPQPGVAAGTAPGQAAPAPDPAPEGRAAVRETLNRSHLQFAFATMQAGTTYPGALAEVAAEADIRQARILQLKLYPVQYDAGRRQITQYRSLTVRLTFQGATTLAPAAPADAWGRAMALLATEHGLLGQWVATQAAVTDAYQAPTGPAARITVDRPGLQRLQAADLLAAGLTLEHPEQLHLWHRDAEVPCERVLSGGSLTEIRFYCADPTTAFSDKAIYLLSREGRPGMAVASQPAVPIPATPLGTTHKAMLHLEEDHFYWANKPSDAHADHWFWETLNPALGPKAFTFQATSIAPDHGLSARLRIGLRGAGRDARIKANQHVEVALNGTRVADLRWSGTDYLETTAAFANDLLVDGTNTLTLTMRTDTGATVAVAYVDAFDLTYCRSTVADNGALTGRFERMDPTTWSLTGFAAEPLLWDVSDAARPVSLTGGVFTGGDLRFADPRPDFARTYVAVEPAMAALPTVTSYQHGDDLHGSASGADYLIVTPPALEAEARRLAIHRQGQGLSTKVVSLSDVYDEFAGGHPEPEAIRRFLRWAVSNWPAPKPAYVVLFGDGHLDYRNHYGTSPTNALPPLLRDNEAIGTIANENGFAAVVGDDDLPDLFIGRLPAADLAEATAIVDKLIAYDRQPEAAWMQEALQVADDDDPGFADFANRMAQTYHSGLNWTGLGVADAPALLSELQSGKGLNLYVGHGYTEGWASEEVFTTYRQPGGTSDIDQLPADDRTGIWVTANCLNGYFHDPAFPSLGEALVKAAHKGAVAFWGTGGYTLPVAQYPMTERFLKYVMDGQDLGTASTLAKISLFMGDSPYWRDEIAAWLLLGDPATRMRRPLPTP
jgi:uncharacterized repeat protein (TIGR01451 family)